VNRRAFLQILSSVAATAVLDPELLLWKPGAKTIFLPPAKELITNCPRMRSLLIVSNAFNVGDFLKVRGEDHVVERISVDGPPNPFGDIAGRFMPGVRIEVVEDPFVTAIEKHARRR